MKVYECLVRSCDHNVITINGHNQLYLAVRMPKTHGSVLHCCISYSTTVSTNNPAHCRPLCFRPLCDRLRRQSFLKCHDTHRVVSCMSRRRVSCEQKVVRRLHGKSSNHASRQQPSDYYRTLTMELVQTFGGNLHLAPG